MKLSSTVRAMMFVYLGGLCGCVPAYNSLLFYTKTNAGLIVEAQPLEVDLDIGRQDLEAGLS